MSERTIRDAAAVEMVNGKERPAASGHRFGPDLVCVDCGQTWVGHQHEPGVCTPPAMDAAELRLGDDPPPYSDAESS